MRLRERCARLGFCVVQGVGCLALGAGLLIATAEIARCQDQSAATPKDAILARKTLMDTVDDHMNAVEGNSGVVLDLDAMHAHADTLSVMLMVFPHLFPPSTDQWKPNVERDPVSDTYASPDVWKNFADFYKQAAAASKLAYGASRAKQEGDFKKAVASLRTACNSCHAAYLKVDQ